MSKSEFVLQMAKELTLLIVKDWDDAEGLEECVRSCVKAAKIIWNESGIEVPL